MTRTLRRSPPGPSAGARGWPSSVRTAIVSAPARQRQWPDVALRPRLPARLPRTSAAETEAPPPPPHWPPGRRHVARRRPPPPRGHRAGGRFRRREDFRRLRAGAPAAAFSVASATVGTAPASAKTSRKAGGPGPALPPTHPAAPPAPRSRPGRGGGPPPVPCRLSLAAPTAGPAEVLVAGCPRQAELGRDPVALLWPRELGLQRRARGRRPSPCRPPAAAWKSP